VAEQDDYDPLLGVDLSSVDLDQIDVDEEEAAGDGSAKRWLGGVMILGAMGTALWLPGTNFYAQYGHTNGFFFLMCGAAVLVGLTGGRWLWAWAQEAAAHYQARRAKEPPKPDQPPSALQRWGTLVAAVGGGIFLLVWLPSSGALSSNDGSGFLAAGGAVVVGLLLGRWLLMQPARPAVQRAPIVLPAWFKWVSLTVLLGGAATILSMTLLYGDDIPENVEFSLGGIALVLGVGAAIWLVRRFDETEARIKAEALRRRRGADSTPSR
jgi:hypothetical protein